MQSLLPTRLFNILQALGTKSMSKSKKLELKIVKKQKLKLKKAYGTVGETAG